MFEIRCSRLILLVLMTGLTACSRSAITEIKPPAQDSPIIPPAVLPMPRTPGTLQEAACRFILPDGLVQGEDVDCYYLTLEEQRSLEDNVSSTRLIRLPIAVFHPPGGASWPDPVIYLSGGPGAGALELVRFQFEAMSEPVFAAGRDLIMFDQRGTGLSQPALDCPEYDELVLELLDRQVDGRTVSEQEITRLLLTSLLSCQDELSKITDLAAYNSAASAADVNDLRLALGYQQVNLWGGSYGTRLALEVMRRYPEGLRSVVLDAVYPPDVDLYLEAPENFWRALERLFQACAANTVCDQNYPDLGEIFFDTVERLNAAPELREIENPFTGEKYQAWLNGDTLLGITFQLLYDSKLRYLLPKQIYAASQGEYAEFDRVRGMMIGLMGISSRGMMFSVQCNEEIPFSSLENFQERFSDYPKLAEMYGNNILGKLVYYVCQDWAAGKAALSANQPVFSAIPALLMSGDFDPITPPKWGSHAAESLENSYFFEFPGIGHGASIADECPTHMMVEFLNDPATAPDDACISEMH